MAQVPNSFSPSHSGHPQLAHIFHGKLHKGSGETAVIAHQEHQNTIMSRLKSLYDATLTAGDHAARYWADVSVHSRNSLAPLASIPGVLATVWTHDTADELSHQYRRSTQAGTYATQYWANVSVSSKHPLAPLASVPGLFAALWTPETAPSTALTLGSAMYGFGSLPKTLTHFTTEAGAGGIVGSGAIRASAGTFAGIPRLGGLFGPGVYMARLAPPLNLFVRAASSTAITVATPAGTARIIPYLVYIRWGSAPLLIP